MNHYVVRRYDPYGNYVLEEFKSDPGRTSRRKKTYASKYANSIKKIAESNKELSLISVTNHAKVGKYILSEICAATCMGDAIHIENGKKYTCRVAQLGKYRQVVLPYCLTSPNDNINAIREIIIGERCAYVFFDKSYGDLHSYIRSKQKIGEEEASRIFKQIVSVVNHCHSAGIVLRDLKLRKFVFKDKARSQVMLHTFDDSILLNEQSDILYEKHGCPAYVSPEILESTGGYSAKAADVWSLGVMLFTMLCGRYPFHDEDPASLFAKIRTGYFTVPDSISPKAKCLLYSILRKEPSERLSAEELLEHPWFQSNFDSVISSRQDRTRCDQLVPDIGKESSQSSSQIS